MNKIILNFLIILLFVLMVLIVYLSTTEVIINPQIVEKEFFIDDI